MSSLRQLGASVRRLPIHPQWLLGTERPSAAVGRLRGTVLDVGSADRWAEKHCADGVRYIALDYPPTGISIYASRPDIFADAVRLPLADESVDAIVCLEVLEHVRDHQAALSEFSRVLRPGGALLLSMPFMYPIHNAPYDFQRLTEFGLRRDLANARFDDVKLVKTGHAIQAAGLLFCLALVGGLQERRRWFDYLRLPFAALGVLIVNLTSYALSAVLPDWDALGKGYEVEARKESSAELVDASRVATPTVDR